MRRVPRFFSRISTRLMAFNLLLVFLPVAGILYLGTYEAQLEKAQVRAMTQSGTLLASLLSSASGARAVPANEILARVPPELAGEVRMRVVDLEGHVVADSGAPSPAPPHPAAAEIRRSWIYRVGSAIVRPLTRWLRPPEPLPEPGDFYEKSERLNGSEVREALKGQVSTAKRAAPRGHRSLILYVAVPVRSSAGVEGAVVVSESTLPILQDLYAVRAGIVRIVLVSVAVAIALSLYVAATIVAPLRRLRLEARSILDRTGRLKKRFSGSNRPDEIGELSRALERLTRRLDSHLRFIETFASDVAHEFKNPLASIRTASEMLAEVEEPEERARFHGMVTREIVRLEKLLSGVREVTILDAEIAREPFTLVSLPEVLAQSVEGVRMRCGSRIAVELDSAGDALVRGSAERLAQAFDNVLDNAASFTPDGGTVRVSARRDGANHVVRCEDEGPGIPESHIGRVFDRFFSYRPTEAKTGHTGLGLSIVKTIVDAHGGSVAAANCEGGGAVFEIALPAA